MSVLTAKVAAIQGGDLREAEAILTAQALALNAIFTEMAICAGLNMKHSLDVVDRCLRLALKAQGQCRATFETLAAIKNPPAAVFAQQANIAHGPQQVNNGVPARTGTTHADACNPQRERNELLEHQDGHRLDTGAAGAAGASGAAMATVGALDRPAHRGKSRSARNADKGGEWRKLREMVKTLNQAMREHREALRKLAR